MCIFEQHSCKGAHVARSECRDVSLAFACMYHCSVLQASADVWVRVQIDGLPRTAARSKYDLDGGAGAVSLLIRISHKVSPCCKWAARAVVGDCVSAYLIRTLKR